MKACICCKQVRPIGDYYAHSGMSDGHLNKCKDCVKQYQKVRRFGDGRSAILSYDRERAKLPHRVLHREKTVRIWTAKYPERKKAQTLLASAVCKGLVHRHPCWVCGDKAEAHHPDYSRPLDVVWLCPAHHKQTHALVKTF